MIVAVYVFTKFLSYAMVPTKKKIETYRHKLDDNESGDAVSPRFSATRSYVLREITFDTVTTRVCCFQCGCHMGGRITAQIGGTRTIHNTCVPFQFKDCTVVVHLGQTAACGRLWPCLVVECSHDTASSQNTIRHNR